MSPPTATTKTEDSNVPLGLSVPANTPHAISVSLPKWKDNVGYEEGEKRVVDSMVSGYPRFFIHLSIVKLARVMEHKHGRTNESCMLFPSQRVAEQCRAFMTARSKVESPDAPALTPRLLSLLICPEDKQSIFSEPAQRKDATLDTTSVNLHIVFFPSTSFSVAKQFWQHTGMGVSSRLAERCLSMLPEELIKAAEASKSGSTTATEAPAAATPSSPTQISHVPKFLGKAHNRHYSVGTKARAAAAVKANPTSPIPSSPLSALAQGRAPAEQLDPDHATYLEERYGRNLPLSYATFAKRALRRRIAGVLVRDPAASSPNSTPSLPATIDEPTAGSDAVALGPSSRGVPNLTENDVYLYPTGMSAIWNAHNLIQQVYPRVAETRKSVCFGFPYTDTLKILEKWGTMAGPGGGCIFYGNGLDSDLDDLEKMLAERQDKADEEKPPILALFTEFPSNPLLRAADLPRLRRLADEHGFVLVVDETIGNFVNVDVLKWADIVVSSLSKVFSGVGNVMGGSLVLNPQSRHYSLFKAHFNRNFEDIYFEEDAIYLERNSRDFIRRIREIDANAEAVCDLLRSRCVSGLSSTDSADSTLAIKTVFYPKYTTSANYSACKLSPASGFGGLFSLTFTSAIASEVFFDTLPFYKGPSLGTNFTLACPYTVLAHYGEFEWAKKYGVEEGLVRVSVGCEESREALLEGVKKAVEAAEEAVKNEKENAAA